MTTIYNGIINNFTQVSNAALLDTRLSAKAYKLYVYMCYRVGSYPSWKFNIFEILKHFKEGETVIRSAFNELIVAGFLERKQGRKEGGKFSTFDYTIYSTTVNTESPPRDRKPHAVNSHAAKPHVENYQHNNKDINNKKSNNKDFIFSASKTKNSLTPEEAQNYKKEKNYQSDMEAFIDYYQPKGWKGITNAYAALDAWERKFLKLNPPQPQKNHDNKKLPKEEKPPIKIDNNNPLWQQSLTTLKNSFEKEVFDKWLSKLNFIEFKDNRMLLAAESKFLRDWIKRQYSEEILESLKKSEERAREVVIIHHSEELCLS